MGDNFVGLSHVEGGSGNPASMKGILMALFSTAKEVASFYQKSSSMIPLMQNEIDITPLTLWDVK